MRLLLMTVAFATTFGSYVEFASGNDPVAATSCALENPGYRFAEFTCSEWIDCDRTCPGYGYGVVACADLLRNCPVCCARVERVSDWAVVVFSVIIIAIICIFAAFVSRAVASGDTDSVLAALAFWWLCFPRRVVAGRGRV